MVVEAQIVHFDTEPNPGEQNSGLFSSPFTSQMSSDYHMWYHAPAMAWIIKCKENEHNYYIINRDSIQLLQFKYIRSLNISFSLVLFFSFPQPSPLESLRRICMGRTRSPTPCLEARLTSNLDKITQIFF